MNKEEKKAVEYAKFLKGHCEKITKCGECLFFDSNDGSCKLHSITQRKITYVKPNISDDEKAILRNIPEKYKWIARDEDGEIYVYEKEPRKSSYYWCNSDDDYSVIKPFNRLFKWCTWEDEDAWYIPDLLKE